VPLFVPEDRANRLVVTEILQRPSLDHLFGTDDVGRDLFLRAIYGGRISLRIGFLAALLSVTIGLTVGAVAGYNQGWIDNALMRVTDALLSIPTLFILIVLTQVVGQSIGVITVVIGGLSWMTVSRLVRANVLSLKEQDFALAARSIGAHPSMILIRHILPNTLAPVVVAATLGVGQAIILEASLSFLGLGVQPPTATWGNMLFRAQSFLVTAPWIALFPGLLILLTVLCVNFIGDGLRDALDPHALR
jgi:peptide/nickel transport system permease protein